MSSAPQDTEKAGNHAGAALHMWTDNDEGGNTRDREGSSGKVVKTGSVEVKRSCCCGNPGRRLDWETTLKWEEPTISAESEKSVGGKKVRENIS